MFFLDFSYRVPHRPARVHGALLAAAILAGCSNTTSGSVQTSTSSGNAGSGQTQVSSASGGSVSGSSGQATLPSSGSSSGVAQAVESGAVSGNTAMSATIDGSADASLSDATESEGGSSCPGVFCEDFEEGQVDTTKWVSYTINGATLEVQTNIVAHGLYAAHFRGLGMGQSYAYLVTKMAPAALQANNFGRAYFYIAQQNSGTPDTGLIWGGTAGFPTPTYLSIAEHSGGWQLGFIKLQGSPGGESQAYPPPPIPVAKWTCLEWEFSDQPTGINLWADGAVIGSLDANDVAYPPNSPKGSLFNGMTSGLIGSFTDFGFGFYDWHPDMKAYDYYYDDIVLDTKRVGCL
jgi:hypothetical protein